MRLTKSDFISYLNCPKSLWLAKRDSERYPQQNDQPVFMEKLAREGYEVEGYVRKFFDMAGDHNVDFQSEFETTDGLYARADVIEKTVGGKTFLYEVKSSTKVKADSTHSHIKDVCFQKICAERSGQRIDQVFLIHLNGEYVRNGAIEPAKLLTVVDVTRYAETMAPETEAEIDAALDFLSGDIDREGCSCLEKSRANHCDTFTIFNPNMPDPSIYSLPRLSASKRQDFISRGIFGIEDIPEDYSLSPAQLVMVRAAKSGKPQMDVDGIRRFLSQLVFPLYFFDYETYGSAVPLIDGVSPHKQFPVQYSLHVLHKDGTLEHKEYLEREARMPINLIKQMQKDIGPTGSLISWHASFEKTQNRGVAKIYPEKATFFQDLNERMVDLEDLFKVDYVDIRFGGSTSIKNILPVVCPALAYGDLDVQNGSSAMDAWQRMIKANPSEAAQIAESLLEYCKMDTFAMVEIYRFLARI